MPLPDFSQFQAVWIEKTKASHNHGGAGWEFGTCLWSPTSSVDGRRIYENMQRVEPGDLILHFYEDRWSDAEENYHFCGYSFALSKAVVRTDQPPEPGTWPNRPSYYRVELREFFPFEKTIALNDFVSRNLEAVTGLTIQPDSPFVLNKGKPRLAEGKYIARCSGALFELLSQEVLDPASHPSQSRREHGMREDAAAYEGEQFEFPEGQRQMRETTYFLRNRSLVAAAKAKLELACQACKFDFLEFYGPLGEGFIECHHLSPLSERSYSGERAKSSRVKDVAVLCANCHRMIHRMMRQEKRWISLDEFTERWRPSRKSTLAD